MTVSSTKPIYFMHIKKCAGTSLVGLAKQQKGIVRLPENNANAIPAHPPELGYKGVHRWIKFWTWPFEEQKQFIQSLNANFFANEGYIDESFQKIDGTFYLTCLRNGVDRCISHYRHMFRNKLVSGKLQDLIDAPENVKGVFNFATYQLSGRKSIGMDTQALEIAKKNLAQFDLIVFSESYEADALRLMTEFGWSEAKKNAKRNISNENDGVLDQLTNEMRTKLSSLNATDEALFEWAIANTAKHT